MLSKKPRKVFGMEIRQEVIQTITQLNGMFNQYLSELQTATVKSGPARPKNR